MVYVCVRGCVSSCVHFYLFAGMCVYCCVCNLQAREDVIKVLKSGLVRPEVLEGHYGTVGPSSALQALQRDGLLTSTSPPNHINVMQRPMTEVRQQKNTRICVYLFLFFNQQYVILYLTQKLNHIQYIVLKLCLCMHLT